MRDHTPWHRLFGIALTDLFTGRPWRVELEKEWALKSQRYRMLIDDFHALSPEDRQALLERMDVADRLRGLAAEERLRGLDTEEILRRLDPAERLRGLDPEQVKAWLKSTGH